MLLERVFLRIGSADSDEKLENVLKKFLAPVLVKLSSQQDGVRKKVQIISNYLLCFLKEYLKPSVSYLSAV